MDVNDLGINSGNVLTSDNEVVNIADVLNAEKVSEKKYDINQYAVSSGLMLDSNGYVRDVAKAIVGLCDELDFVKNHCLLYEEFNATNESGATTISSTVKTDVIISCTGSGTISYIDFKEAIL